MAVRAALFATLQSMGTARIIKKYANRRLYALLGKGAVPEDKNGFLLTENVQSFEIINSVGQIGRASCRERV